MRVISGNLRGTKLKATKGDITRPTLDMVKEAMFNIISPYVQEAIVLDLFSGSGALAIESLSRLASFAVINDKSKKAVNIIKENINKTRLQDKVQILNLDYKEAIQKVKDQKFDIIFIDPPYEEDFKIDAIKRISVLNLLNDGGIIVLETDNKQEIPEVIGNYKIIDQRKYGKVLLCLFARKG